MKSSASGKYRTILTLVILAPAFIGAAIFMLTAISRLINPMPVNYSEDSILVMVMEILSGNSIYSPRQYSEFPYNLSPYTPLYYYIVAIVDSITGISMFGGRLVATFSALFSAFLIAAISRKAGADKSLSLVGGLVFLSIYPVMRWAGLHRVDFTAIMFSLAGVYFLVSANAGSKRIFAAALMFFLAFMAKHSSVSAPAAAFLCLLFTNRKDAFRLAVSLFGLVIISLIVLSLSSGNGFLYCITATFKHPFSLSRLKVMASVYFLRLDFMVMIGLWVLGGIYFRRKGLGLLMVWPILSIVQALLGVAKIGSGPNYFIEPAAALCILWPVVMEKVSEKSRALYGGAVFALAAAIVAGFVQHRGIHVADISSIFRSAQKHESMVMPADIINRYSNGKYVLAQYPMIVLGTNARPASNDPLTFSVLARVGAWDQSGMLERLENGDISLVITDNILPIEKGTKFFTTEMEELVLKHYAILTIQSEKVFYIRKNLLPPEAEETPEP